MTTPINVKGVCEYCGKWDTLSDGRFCSEAHERLERELPARLEARYGRNVAALAMIFHGWNPAMPVEVSPTSSRASCINGALRLADKHVIAVDTLTDAQCAKLVWSRSIHEDPPRLREALGKFGRNE